MPVGHLFSGVPAELPEELIEELITSSSVRIERIVSKGHASPDGFWYDQSEHEWVVLLRGEALLEVEGESAPLQLKPGMHIDLPAHVKHRVAWTAPDVETIWLAVFYS